MEPASKHGGKRNQTKTAKIFQNGGSQAVRIPSEYRFDTEEVNIRQVGNQLILSPKIATENRWAEFRAKWPGDPEFHIERDNEPYDTKDIF